MSKLEISENDKQILRSTAPLVVVITLFVIVGKFAVTQVTNLRNQISEAKKTQSVLSNKLNVLRSISQVSVSGTNTALIALPRSNPSLQVMSQLKSLASSNLVVMEEIKVSMASDGSDSLSYITTSFSIIGPKDAIISFVKSVDTIAPITFVEKMELVEDSGLGAANITTKTYYATLPTTIPTVTQPITDLTSAEKDLLSQISGLSQSSIEIPTSASVSGINPNPFGQ